jgi:hypothetical protein
MKTELCEIMTKYGSDKGNGPHNYTIFYYELFKNKKNESLNIFELGLGTNNTDVPSNMGKNGKPGASLRGWRDFFINSNIYGADIDKRILFNENRIKTFYCDQKNEKIIKEMWNNEELKDLLFDIIIEDGLHEFQANLKFLTNTLYKLKLGGYYICEDLLPQTIIDFENEFNNLNRTFSNFSFEIIKLENSNNRYNDNNLLVIKKIN